MSVAYRGHSLYNYFHRGEFFGYAQEKLGCCPIVPSLFDEKRGGRIIYVGKAKILKNRVVPIL